MNRKQIAIVSVVTAYCLVYFLLSWIPIATFFLPKLSVYSVLALWVLIIFYLLIFCSFVFQRLFKFEYGTVKWLKLHCFFGWIQLLSVGLLASLWIIMWSALKPDSNVALFLLVWYLSFIVGVPILFQRVKNTLGMNYTKISIPSLEGTVGFAELSEMKLGRKQSEGLEYLRQSLFILKENLSQEEKSLKDLDKTILAIDILSSFEQKIPYKQLRVLAGNLVKMPSLSHIPEALNNFLMSSEISWTQAFSELPSKRQREKVTSFAEKYLLPIALVIVTLLGILPENNRVQIIDFLEKLQWTQVVGMFIVLFLVYEFFSLLNRFYLSDVAYSDIKDLLTLQDKRKLSQQKAD